MGYDNDSSSKWEKMAAGKCLTLRHTCHTPPEATESEQEKISILLPVYARLCATANFISISILIYDCDCYVWGNNRSQILVSLWRRYPNGCRVCCSPYGIFAANDWRWRLCCVALRMSNRQPKAANATKKKSSNDNNKNRNREKKLRLKMRSTKSLMSVADIATSPIINRKTIFVKIVFCLLPPLALSMPVCVCLETDELVFRRVASHSLTE